MFVTTLPIVKKARGSLFILFVTVLGITVNLRSSATVSFHSTFACMIRC